MKKRFLALAVATFSVLAAPGYAANAVCEKSADDKKLTGAARAAHIKKCDKGPGAAVAGSPACEKSAADKKLAGAAKKSHIAKCMADASAKK
jgi:hypothetical protein